MNTEIATSTAVVDVETVGHTLEELTYVVEKPAKKAKKPAVKNEYELLIQQYSAAFKFFNEKLFNNELKMPMITIQTQGRRNCYGWFWPKRWTNNGEPQDEINMAAENINRSKADQCETLVHEMVHLYNSQLGLKDCNAVQYHNKHFKTAAENAKLIVEKTPGKGCAKTKLSEELTNLINEMNIKFLENINRPKMQSNYTKMFFVSVNEDDQKMFRKMCIDNDLTQKEMFATLIEQYNNNNNEE